MRPFTDFSVLTFDCYGTLIDWETGLRDALEPILAAHGVGLPSERALEMFGELETAAEAGAYRRYRAVLGEVLEGFGRRLGFSPTPEEVERFAGSVPSWPPFGDSPNALRAFKQRYRLAIISNIDDDLIARSAETLGVAFDWIVTAEQARSYKPSPNNFRAALDRIGTTPNEILHVAQSLFHDIAPAKSLGWSTVWVNRRQGRVGPGATPPAAVQPDLEVPDLVALARAMNLL